MTPDDYCQDKAAAPGSSTYYSVLFLPEEQRRAVTALYAFYREVDNIVDEVSEPNAARMKLAWWRSEIDRVFDGHPDHPVARALLPAVEQFELPRERFDEVIRGREMDLEHEGFARFDELAEYCYYAGAAVALLATEILGYGESATRQSARDLGLAQHLVHVIHDVKGAARRGRIYLPADEMETHGVQPTDLLHESTPDNLRNLLAVQARRAREYHDRALATLPAADRYAQCSGLILGRISMTLLDEIERDGFRVLEHQVALTPLRKLWIAWRCDRAEQRQRRRLRRQKVSP